MDEQLELPTVTSQTDLHALWSLLMQPLGTLRPRLYLLFVADDGTVMPHISDFVDLPSRPSARSVDELLATCRQLIDMEFPEDSRAAFLYMRPGDAALREEDVVWTRALYDAAQRHTVPMWPTHVAGDDTIRVVAADDLAA